MGLYRKSWSDSRIVAIVALACLAGTVLSAQGAWALTSYTITQVTAGSFDHKWPSINNKSNMVWSQKDPATGFWQVFMQASPTSGTSVVPITSSSQNHERPVISDNGDIVYFKDQAGGGVGYEVVRLSGGAESIIEFSSRNNLTGDQRVAGKNFGIAASTGTTISYYDFVQAGFSVRRFNVSGLGKLQCFGGDCDFSGFDFPDINKDGVIVYSDDFRVNPPSIYIATTGSPLSLPVAVGQFPHIADGLTPELVYISGGAQVVSTVGGLVHAGVWADVNKSGNIIFEDVVGGFSQVFLAKPRTGMNSLAVGSGDQQHGFINTTLPLPLTVTVTDPSGNPVSGVSISFAITQQPSGTVGSSLSTTNITTAADGTASTQLVLGDTPGDYQVTASCASCTPQSVTFTETANRSPDLSISKIDPVQVVFPPSDFSPVDLVLGKATAFRVGVGLDDINLLTASTVDVQIQFEGGTYSTPTDGLPIRESDFSCDQAGHNCEATTIINLLTGILPSNLGQEFVTATVDPNNLIPDSDPTNNTKQRPVDILLTLSLTIPYFKVSCSSPGCYGSPVPSAAVDTFNKSGDFIFSTYPVSGITTILGDFQGVADPTWISGINVDLINLWEAAKIVTPNADRVVGLVPYSPTMPNSYFCYHNNPPIKDLNGNTLDCKQVLGLYKQVAVKSTLSAVGAWTTPAHEIGHSYGLHRSPPYGPGEEYITNQPGNCASGFLVEGDQSIENGICFMGLAPYQSFTSNTACFPNGPQLIRDIWIDNPDYASLLQTLSETLPGGDPEILIVAGIVTKDDTIQLFPWYIAQNGTSTAPSQGDYSIEFIGASGELVASSALPVDFNLYLEGISTPIQPIPTGTSPFAFSTLLPPGLVSVNIKHGSTILVNFNLSTELLHDAVASIPDAGFVENPTQRRNALQGKIGGLDALLSARDLTGARNKLKNDIRKHLDDWLLDGYTTQSPLQYTKSAILALVDELLQRLGG